MKKMDGTWRVVLVLVKKKSLEGSHTQLDILKNSKLLQIIFIKTLFMKIAHISFFLNSFQVALAFAL